MQISSTELQRSYHSSALLLTLSFYGEIWRAKMYTMHALIMSLMAYIDIRLSLRREHHN